MAQSHGRSFSHISYELNRFIRGRHTCVRHDYLMITKGTFILWIQLSSMHHQFYIFLFSFLFFFNTHDSALINEHLLSSAYLLKMCVTMHQSAFLSPVLLPPQPPNPGFENRLGLRAMKLMNPGSLLKYQVLQSLVRLLRWFSWWGCSVVNQLGLCWLSSLLIGYYSGLSPMQPR